MTPVPHRPRLADQAALRRHFVDGEEKLLLFHLEREEMMQLEPRQVAILRCLDGTRDLNGVVLEAVRRRIFRRASEIEQLLADLAARGLLVDGIEVRPRRAEPGELPLSVLPVAAGSTASFRLRCSLHGMCCGTYSTVPFSQPEAVRASDLVPDAIPPGASDADVPRSMHAFLPVVGSVDGHFGGVTMVDGHCAFLDGEQRCRVHLAAGEGAKPLGCQIFPATFTDDGAAIRVSVAVECACVLSSLEADGGASLVPEAARTERDLVASVRVVRLPELLPASRERSATRAEARAFADAVVDALGDVADPVAAVWSLAGVVRERGLDLGAAAGALACPVAPPTAALGFRVMALSAMARDKHEEAQRWRSVSDRARRLAAWLAPAAEDLMDPALLGRVLAQGPRRLAHERFYLRAGLFGHQLWAHPKVTFEQALRDRAVRLLLARQLDEHLVDEVAEHPARDYPLTAVESMMRGQGMERYAHGIP